MVYESRVGDIIALGTSSWRISEITRDRVIVEPAPGRSARLPFWHGEGVGRPAETGRARGAFLRAVAAGMDDGAAAGTDLLADAASGLDSALRERLAAAGLDEDAQGNLAALVRAQREATGVVPDDRTLVVERCEDETGDWRVMLHSPYGRRVHEPWAMAVQDRVERTLGFDPQAMAADDGILLRVPMTETRLPGAELFAFDPDELVRIVRDRVDKTALFAARFRECAARALALSPTRPGKRAPLWQQRLKAGQLLEAARGERDFPILLETARECLQDVYDLDALHELMEGLAAGTVRMVEAQTSIPSPFAGPLLFGYVGEHLYQGDLPHAERQASLLSLDPALLGELLGTADLGELLDPQVVAQVEAQLQRLAPDRRARGVEGAADLLRVLGPLAAEEAAARLEALGGSPGSGLEDCDAEAAASAPSRPATPAEACALLEKLRDAKRAFPAMIGGVERWAAVEDAGRLREALGTAVPAWVPAAFLEVPDAGDGPGPLDGLVARYARTHGPFAEAEVATRLGIGPSVARESLRRLAAAGNVQGRFGCADGPGPAGVGAAAGSTGAERTWVAAEVFRRLRSRSLAKARAAVRAVPASAYARYVLDLQGVGAGGGTLEGAEGVAQVISQFEGVFLPAAAWEGHVFPSRVRDFRPSMLDELVAAGEVVWAGGRREDGAPPADGGPRARKAGKAAAAPVLVAFYPTDSPLVPVQADAVQVGAEDVEPAVRPSVEEAVVEALASGYGLFFRQIADAVRRRMEPERVDEASIAAALQELVWSGRATNDTFAPVRAAEAAASGTRPRPAPKRRASSRRSRYRGAAAGGLRAEAAERVSVAGIGVDGAALSGRWSLLAPSPENDTVRAVALVESILDRYGVLARDVALLSGVSGGLGALMPVLRSMEDAGDLLRGMFVKGLGPAQFAARETVDLLRTYAAEDDASDARPVTRGARCWRPTIPRTCSGPACRGRPSRAATHPPRRAPRAGREASWSCATACRCSTRRRACAPCWPSPRTRRRSKRPPAPSSPTRRVRCGATGRRVPARRWWWSRSTAGPCWTRRSPTSSSGRASSVCPTACASTWTRSRGERSDRGRCCAAAAQGPRSCSRRSREGGSRRPGPQRPGPGKEGRHARPGVRQRLPMRLRAARARPARRRRRSVRRSGVLYEEDHRGRCRLVHRTVPRDRSRCRVRVLLPAEQSLDVLAEREGRLPVQPGEHSRGIQGRLRRRAHIRQRSGSQDGLPRGPAPARRAYAPPGRRAHELLPYGHGRLARRPADGGVPSTLPRRCRMVSPRACRLRIRGCWGAGENVSWPAGSNWVENAAAARWCGMFGWGEGPVWTRGEQEVAAWREMRAAGRRRGAGCSTTCRSRRSLPVRWRPSPPCCWPRR